MSTVIEIIDAVKNLTSVEQAQLLQKLRELGLEPARPSPADYQSPEFTRELTEHFHRAKRRALADE